jgi:uncharacterized RDD family membrane protein YckC
VTPTVPAAARDEAVDPFTVSLVTPEAVLLQFRPAGLASRMVAISLDLMIQFSVLYVLVFGLILVGGGDQAVAVVSGLVVVFLVIFGYPALLETFWDGTSVGKRAMGLRVVTTEGGPVRFRHAAIRSLLFLVDFWLPPGGLTGVSTALLTRRGQRLGDLAAGTIVVRVRRTADRVAPVWFSPPPGYEAYTATLDVTGLHTRQYQLVRRFLLRLGELAPPARSRLARRLAEGVAAATGNPVPGTVHPEVYLVCTAAAFQQRSAQSLAGFAPPPPAGGRLVGPPPPPGQFGAGR